MQTIEFPTTARELGGLLGAEVLGDENLTIETLGSLESATKEAGVLTFFSDKKHSSLLTKLQPSAVLTTQELSKLEAKATYLVVKDPKRVFAELAKSLLPKNPWNGISLKAEIHVKAQIEEGVNVGPFAIICEGAQIKKGTTIYPYAYVGPNVQIGKDCEIHPQVTLLENVIIGNHVRIFSGSVLGSEGFGFLEGADGFTAMPQVGKVIIEDNVRIGAKCTIDRGTLGETRIKKGAILDDQIHVGHNCVVGERNALCAQVGLAGSTILEEDVMLGGQVGLAGHLTVGKGARLAGQTGASTNLPGGKTYLSSPALPIEDAIKTFRATRKLASLIERVRKLEEQNGKPQS